MASLFSGLAEAVSEHDRGQAVGYLSHGSGFVVVTVYKGPKPGEGRVDSHTPEAAYRILVGTFDAYAGEEAPALLGSVVGPIGPLRNTRRGPTRHDPTAGAEFVIRLGARTLSGKVG